MVAGRAMNVHAAVGGTSALTSRPVNAVRLRARSLFRKRLPGWQVVPCAVHCNTSAWLARLHTPARETSDRLPHDNAAPKTIPQEPPTDSAYEDLTAQAVQLLFQMLDHPQTKDAFIEGHVIRDLLQLATDGTSSNPAVNEYMLGVQLDPTEDSIIPQLVLGMLSRLMLSDGSIDSRVLDQVSSRFQV